MAAANPSDTPGSAPDGKPTTAVPFLIAAGVAVLLIALVLVWSWVRPSNERLSDAAQIQRTIGQHYGAQNKQLYPEFVATVCAKDKAAVPAAAEFAKQQAEALKQHGEATVDAINNITVTGDRATAGVEISYAHESGTKIPKPTVLIREDDAWKVCS